MKDIVFGFLIIALVVFGIGLKFFGGTTEPPLAKPVFEGFNIDHAERTQEGVEYSSATTYSVRTRSASKREVRFLPDGGEEKVLATDDGTSAEMKGVLNEDLGSGILWVRAYNSEGVYVDTQRVRIIVPKKESVPDFSKEIEVQEPLAGSSIKSPLTVKGRVLGPWLFEASMPVTLLDGTGKVLAKAPVQAKGEWMTTEFVEFEGVLNFIVPKDASEGVLVFENDNPSGMPEHAKSFSIPVRFE